MKRYFCCNFAVLFFIYKKKRIFFFFHFQNAAMKYCVFQLLFYLFLCPINPFFIFSTFISGGLVLFRHGISNRLIRILGLYDKHLWFSITIHLYINFIHITLCLLLPPTKKEKVFCFGSLAHKMLHFIYP